MKNELENIYANQVLISEGKKTAKKNCEVKGGKGATKGGSGFEEVVKATPKGGATERIKGLKKPEEDKKRTTDMKKTKIKESKVPNTFDQIFQSIINEDFGSGDESTEIKNTEDAMASGDEYGDELGDETQHETSEEGEEGAEETEGEVVDELQEIITKLSELIAKLSGAEEEEEESEDEGEAEPEETTEEEGGEEDEVSKYEESLDLKGSLSELSDRLVELLQKKDNKVKGTLSKAKSGKASAGSIPTASEKPTPFNPSIKHLQNPKGSNQVSSTVKKGEYLFK